MQKRGNESRPAQKERKKNNSQKNIKRKCSLWPFECGKTEREIALPYYFSTSVFPGWMWISSQSEIQAVNTAKGGEKKTLKCVKKKPRSEKACDGENLIVWFPACVTKSKISFWKRRSDVWVCVFDLWWFVVKSKGNGCIASCQVCMGVCPAC